MSGYRLQEPPNAVQIELVEGCQLRCSFCGLNGIREPKKNNFKFMSMETLRSLVNSMTELKWNSRIEFAMHGEPTMHPNLIEMIAATRELAPKLPIMMTSNGGGLMRNTAATIKELFAAGLDTLALDDYVKVSLVERIRDAISREWERLDYQVYDYPEAGSIASPHARVNQKRLIYVQDISQAVAGNHSLINNHAGAGAPKVAPEHKSQTQRCAKPFRELSVRWDGNVAICCNDWRGVYKCGNVVRDGLDAVWNGRAMGAARVRLYSGTRNFGPCTGCDAVSYRVGLLPDRMGKDGDSMDVPTVRVANDIRKAVAGPTYTDPVLRPWEKKPGQRDFTAIDTKKE